MELNTVFKEVSLDYLKETKIYNELQRCLSELENGQEILYALKTNTEDKSLTLLKVGSLLSFSIIQKMWISDSFPNDFTHEDWAEITKKVTDFGILADGRQYTEFVFSLYSDYIEFSVNVNDEIFTENQRSEILDLSEQLKELGTQLEEEKIKEPDYVDRCLWISYEAIIKLLSSYFTCFMSPKFREFFQAVPDLAVQYARLTIYSKEKALLEEYLDHQYALDAELENKYNNYILELVDRTKYFNDLIEKAFDPDFKNELINSVNLAKHAGVEESKILKSLEKIDDYFS